MREVESFLFAERQAFTPKIPSLLEEPSEVSFVRGKAPSHGENVRSLFPKTSDFPFVTGKRGAKREVKALRIGVVFSGGQASGGHNVIAGLFDALKALSSKSLLFGFLGGPSGIVEGKTEEITAELLSSYRNQGGFDLIGSGRTKIETEEQLEASLSSCKKLSLDGLVVIGGDDSNTNAAILSEYFLSKGSSIQVIGVPKTIDGDLKNEHIPVSFGFDTACRIYSELIGNIARDSLSAKKYYHFIKLMGRSASNVTLECALQTHPNLALIGEEIAHDGKTVADVTNQIADLICARAEEGKHYGVVLIPEGVIEFIPECKVLIGELNRLLATSDLSLHEVESRLSQEARGCFQALPESVQKQLLLDRDPHGNVQVSLIETERLFIETVKTELKRRAKEGSYKGKFNAIGHFFGYEGRAGYPSNFDTTYCYALGMTAALLLDEGLTCYIAQVTSLEKPVAEWQIGGVPITSLLTFEERKGKLKPVIEKALVELTGKPFAFYKKMREKWGIEDSYRFPGPIQFRSLPIEQTLPLTLLLEKESSCGKTACGCRAKG